MLYWGPYFTGKDLLSAQELTQVDFRIILQTTEGAIKYLSLNTGEVAWFLPVMLFPFPLVVGECDTLPNAIWQ